VFICIFTALVLGELVLASLVDRFPKTEELERDEVSRPTLHCDAMSLVLCIFIQYGMQTLEFVFYAVYFG